MKSVKIPNKIRLRKLFARLKSELTRSDTQDFALFCLSCGYIWFPLREFPKTCTMCHRYFKHGWYRINERGEVLIYFQDGVKHLIKAFNGEEVTKE